MEDSACARPHSEVAFPQLRSALVPPGLAGVHSSSVACGSGARPRARGGRHTPAPAAASARCGQDGTRGGSGGERTGRYQARLSTGAGESSGGPHVSRIEARSGATAKNHKERPC